MKTISTTLFLNIYLFSLVCFAQQEWDMTPQPPDAAAFSTYGAYPVSYYTGSPDVSIPLFTIDEGEISVPLTLSYNARGMRVADESTWVGLGWNLYPGGSITRIVMGSQYDNHDSDMYNVFLNHWQSGYDAEYLQKSYSTGYWGVLTEGDVYSIEGGLGNYGSLTDFSTTGCSIFESYASLSHMFQPDIFTFSFLGYSGKFYIDPESDEAVILDKKKHLIINKDATSWDPETDGWEVILPNGVKVYFQDIEKVDQPAWETNCSSSPPSLTWKITRIEMKNGEEINFQYNSTTYETASISDYDVHAFEDDADYQLNYTKSGYGNFDPPFLQNDCPSTNYATPVTIRNQLKTLSQITSPKYTVNFTTVVGSTKPRLASMEVLDNCDESFSIGYSFTLAPFSCADGAWNEWRNSSGAAQTYGSVNNFVKYKLTQVQKYTAQSGSITNYGNPYKFEYQEDIGLPSILSFAQDYWGYYNGQVSNKGLIPDESQMYATGGPYPEEYLPDRFPTDDLRVRANSNRGVSPSHLVQGILRKITYPTVGYSIFNFEPHSFYLSDMTDYILLASEIYYNGLYYVNNYNGSPTAISQGAGLRIKEIINYDGNAQFVGRKKFDYGESGILLEPIHFWRIEPQVTVVPNNDMLSQYMTDDELFYYKIWSASSSNHNQSFAIPNSVGYSHVDVIDSDSETDNANEVTNGTAVYRFYNYPTVYNLQLSRVSAGYLDSRNGQPSSIEFFDEAGISLKKTAYHYTKVSNSLFLSIGLKQVNKSATDGYNIFKVEYTPMKAEWWKQDWVEEIQDGVSMTTAFEYSVDVNARLTKQTTSTSENKEIEIDYYYAQDNPSNIQTSASTISAMIASNMVEVPLKTEKKVDGILTEGSIVNYGSDLFPSSTYELAGSSYNLKQTFVYQQGKLIQYAGNDGVPTSFLWGCDYTKPVAKAVGVSYSVFNAAFSAVAGDLNALNSYSTLSNALVTTFTYKPLMGLSSQLNPNGVVTLYEYDALGRLELIKDEDGNIVRHYGYHYKEQ